jgi:hypothetical protein
LSVSQENLIRAAHQALNKELEKKQNGVEEQASNQDDTNSCLISVKRKSDRLPTVAANVKMRPSMLAEIPPFRKPSAENTSDSRTQSSRSPSNLARHCSCHGQFQNVRLPRSIRIRINNDSTIVLNPTDLLRWSLGEETVDILHHHHGDEQS